MPSRRSIPCSPRSTRPNTRRSAPRVREFLAKEVVPHHAAWEEAGVVDRAVWLKAGEQGLLGMDVAEEFGGGGVKDFRYNAILAAEVSRVGASGLGFTLHNDVVAPVPHRAVHRRAEGALAARLRQRRDHHRHRHERAGRRLRPAGPARRRPSATATTGCSTGRRPSSPTGILADLVLVVARTDPEAGARGFSLLVVERGMPGLRARPQARQDRDEGAGHRRAVLRGRARAGRQPARHRGPRASST